MDKEFAERFHCMGNSPAYTLITGEYPTAGVIVGRFQVPKLTEGHLDVFNQVFEKHDRVVVFLGVARTKITRNNPMDFETRKAMILEHFPNLVNKMLTVLPIEDVGDDLLWSEKLDVQIASYAPTGAILYGSRDSFLGHYKGKYKTCMLESSILISGTAIRNAISQTTKSTPEFREGVIWAAFGQYPKVWATVDVAVIDRERKQVLLGRKPYQELFRFLGGFTEPTTIDYEADAAREVREEANIEVSNIQYIGSSLIDDWRYRNEVDKIKTTFWLADYDRGNPEPKDDIAELKWVPMDGFWNKVTTGNLIVKEHLPLAEMFARRIIKDNLF